MARKELISRGGGRRAIREKEGRHVVRGGARSERKNKEEESGRRKKEREGKKKKEGKKEQEDAIYSLTLLTLMSQS